MSERRAFQPGWHVPSGWRWTKIGDMAEVSTGGTPDTGRPDFYGGANNWLKSGDVKGTYIEAVPQRITDLGVRHSNAKVHPAGTVMLAMSGQGKTRGTSAILRVPSACSQSVAAILPTSQAIPETIHWALRLRYHDVRHSTGDGERTGLNLRNVRDIYIPLPPLAEQERIAGRLSEQLATVDRARAAAEARLAAAEALPAAYFREIFEGLDGSAPTRRLVDISDIASGVTLGKRPHAVCGREVPYLRVANVQDGYLRLDSVYTIRATDDEIQELALRRGDLVLTEGGDRDKLGRGTWWNNELPECIHQNHIFRVRLHDGVVEHEFFGFQIRSAYAKYYFLANAKQTTGIATINRRVLDGLPVLLPPLLDQRRIAADLAARLAAAERMAEGLRAELAAIEALPAALLRDAFGGIGNG